MVSRTGRGEPRCALCGEAGDQRELTSIGGVLQSIGPLLGPFQHNTYVHRLCALWSPEVYHEGDQIRNVMAAVRRGRSLRCTHCGRKGATVGCCVDWCQKTYHIRCAQKAGCEINALEWILSCPEHSRRFRAQSKTVKQKGKGGGQGGKDHLTCVPCGAKDSHESKRSKTSHHQMDNIRASLFGDTVDIDEEYFQRKQQHRIQRDIKSLKPYALGSSVAEQSQGTASKAKAEGGKENTGTPATLTFDAGWESVGGHEDVKRALKEAVLLPLMYQSEFSRLNLSCPKGVLLYGEPGTGKTMVVRALAKECNRCVHIRKISFFSRKGADLLGKFQGEAERKLRILFQEAEKSAPSIIFFDELDGIAPARGGRVSDQIHTSVVSTLLSLMDGLVDRGKVVVIAATNRADAIDPALRRPGRFDREIYFPLPDVEQRVKILLACTRQWNVKPQMAQIDRMAVLTEGFAGADLQNLCTNAALARLRREFPNILDGVEENKRIENFESKLDSIFVEDRDFVFALQNITKACSHRTISGMLTTCNLQPIPLFVLDAVWRPLYTTVCACNNLKADATHLMADQCPVQIKKHLAKIGAVSSSVLISATESKVMASTQKDLTQPLPMPNTNILISGEISSSLVVAESVLSTLSGFRIIKISLPQVIRDGHDNIANGIISLTTKALSSAHSERIAIYCPNIHDWLNAVDVDAETLIDPSGGHAQSDDLDTADDSMTVWNSFMQALENNRSSDSKLMVLATCNLPRESIPTTIKSFFQDARGETRSKKIVEMEGVQGKLEALSAATAQYLVAALSSLVKIARTNAQVQVQVEDDVPMSSDGKLDGASPNDDVDGKASMSKEVSIENEACQGGNLVDNNAGSEKGDGSAVQTRDGLTEAAEIKPEEYLCAISLEVGANLKCSSNGCSTRIHSKYLRHLELEGSFQKQWKCELCRRKECFDAEDLEEISKVEMETINGVGLTLLNDQRCGLSHARSTEIRHNSVSLAFLDVASNACKGKYKLMSHLKAAGKLALSGILQQQATVDSLAARRGAAQIYFVSTSAAFATMDKIESFCWKFNQFVAKKNPKFEPISDEQLPTSEEAQQEQEPSLQAVKAKKEEDGRKILPTLQPQIFQMPLSSEAAAVDHNEKSLAMKVAGVLEKLLCEEKRLGHVQDCIFRILTHLFLSISEKAFETKTTLSGEEVTGDDLITDKHLEQLLFASIQHCLGSTA